MKSLNETINEYRSFFQERDYPLVERNNFQTPKSSNATFTFCSGMFYEDFYEGSQRAMPDREIIHQYAIRTDSFYKIGHSPKHLLFFNMLGLFEFNQPNKYSSLENILEFLTNSIDASKISLNVPQKIDSDKNFKDIINQKGLDYEVFLDENLMWATSLNSPYNGLRIEINYKDENSFVELWNIGYIQDKGNLIAIDSGICAERLNMAQNGLSNVYEIEDFVKIKNLITSLPRINKNYFLYSKDLNTNPIYSSNKELNLIADLYRTTRTLLESGVNPIGKKDKKGMHLRNFLKKQFAFMYINGFDLESVAELYPQHARIIQEEVKLFNSNMRLESIDAKITEIQKTMEFSHPLKGDKFFRNRSKKLSSDELKTYRQELHRKLSLDDLSVINWTPFEVLFDWAITNELLADERVNVSDKEELKNMCEQYKTNLLLFKRGELL
jgi:alanyl-tRNA synthetase